MHTCVLVADEGNIYVVLDRFTNYEHEQPKPDSRWDYFGIGGRFEGALPLRQPRKLRRFFGLLPAGETSQVSVAKKAEVHAESFLADPPAALYFRGKLYECPLDADADGLKRWQEEFRKLYADIPDETKLQIVDAHS